MAENIGGSIARRTFANIGGEAMIGLGESLGIDLMASSAGFAAVAGIGSTLLPAIGVGLLAYELIDML